MNRRPALVTELEQAAAGVFTVEELLARPDADATFDRVAAAVGDTSPDPELVVTLTALAVLRARHAHERTLS